MLALAVHTQEDCTPRNTTIWQGVNAHKPPLALAQLGFAPLNWGLRPGCGNSMMRITQDDAVPPAPIWSLHAQRLPILVPTLIKDLWCRFRCCSLRFVERAALLGPRPCYLRLASLSALGGLLDKLSWTSVRICTICTICTICSLFCCLFES